MTTYLKFKTVMRKNFTLWKHYFCSTLIHICCPILAYFFLSFMRSGVVLSDEEESAMNLTKRDAATIYKDLQQDINTIYYTPKYDFTTKLLNKASSKLGIKSKDVIGFTSKRQMFGYFRVNGFHSWAIAVAFNDIEKNDIPRHLDYSIIPSVSGSSGYTTEILDLTPVYKPGEGSWYYFKTHFIALQMAIETSFIEMSAKSTLKLSMQEFPFPREKVLNISLKSKLAALAVYGFVVTACMLIYTITEEKNSGIEELIRMTGVKKWILWIGWFLPVYLNNIISVLFIVLILKTALLTNIAVLPYCDATVLFSFLMLYCAAGVSFCFVISAFYRNSSKAVFVGFFVWNFTFHFTASYTEGIVGMSKITKMLLSLFPNGALYYGFEAITAFDRREINFDWTNIYSSADDSGKDVTMGEIFVILITDIIIYLTFTLYADHALPGLVGYYRLLRFRLSEFTKKYFKMSREGSEESTYVRKSYCSVEASPSLKPVIQLRNIFCKKRDKITALNDVSINMYEEEVTVLLGQVGTGKSTIISLLTGAHRPTSGEVLINGLNVTRNLKRVHNIMGFCPQNDACFPYLTVLEHLEFFGALKGMSPPEAHKHAQKLLVIMKLVEKRDTFASEIYGDLQRKLSLGIAFLGDPQIVILDEPTSDLDEEDRKSVWDMIIALRSSQTIIVTTHYMEEAEMLGDRIAIIKHGKLMCYGTHSFLKEEFDVGYYLTLSLRQDNTMQAQITDIIAKKINTAILRTSGNNSVKYFLPLETKSYFSGFLQELEDRRKNLGITNIEISVTTMEDVFIRIEDYIEMQADERTEDLPTSNLRFSKITAKVTEMKLFQIQVWSLLVKRVDILSKQWRRLLFTTILLLFILFIEIDLLQVPLELRKKKMGFPLTLKKYGKTTVYYESSDTSPHISEIENQYTKQIEGLQSLPEKAENVSQAILDMGMEDILFYTKSLVVASQMEVKGSKQTINIMYSNKAYHGAPISLNLITNAVLKGTFDNKSGISVSNAPISVDYGFHSPYQLKYFFPFGMCILGTLFIHLPHAERSSQMKQLQLMSGVGYKTYWFTNFAYDLIVYLLIVLVLLLSINIYGIYLPFSPYIGRNQLRALFIILLVYGINVIPFMYLLSYNKSKRGTVNRFLVVSVFAITTATIMEQIFEKKEQFFYAVTYICSIYPPYRLAYLLILYAKITMKFYKQEYYMLGDLESIIGKQPTYFGGSESLIFSVIRAILTSVMYFFILFFLETSYFIRYREIIKKLYYEEVLEAYEELELLEMKPEIKNEMRRISEVLKHEKLQERGIVITRRRKANELFLAYNLEKSERELKVVKNVSFAVNSGEYFGLLAVNDKVGKDIVLRILTGSLPLLEGEVRILKPTNERVYLSKKPKEYLKNIGYCPQSFEFTEALTGRQILKLFAHLRGITTDVQDEVTKYIEALGLEEEADIKCSRISEGSKRRLSVAIALIGSPLVILLDEPTSGMDTMSRKLFRNVLFALKHRDVKPAVIVTTRRVTEFQRLCNRLAVMNDGQLEYTGTIKDLQKEFDVCVTVVFKLKLSLSIIVHRQAPSLISESTPPGSSKSNKVVDKIMETQIDEDHAEVRELMSTFEGTFKRKYELQDKQPGFLQYQVNDKTRKWSELFEIMENLKQQYRVIEDYTLNQTTLEDVYMTMFKSESRKPKVLY